MEPVGIILLVLFLVIIVMGPMSLRQNECKTECSRKGSQSPTPSDGYCTSQAQYRDHFHNSAPSECSGHRYPICIGPLVPEPTYTVTQDPRPVLEHVSTVTSHKTTSQAKSQETVGQTEEVTDTNDDVLTINACGHSFHSKCLSSWFLIDRYDCPVCRVPYYKGIPRHQQALNVSPFWPFYFQDPSFGRVRGILLAKLDSFRSFLSDPSAVPTVKGLDRGIRPTIVLFSRRAPRKSQCELPGDAGGITCSVALPYIPGNNDSDSPTYSPYNITSYPDHA
ncbi:unnamed protein product [Fusarium venenatum]|uniref:RING-type domain-containing protein n=1 Tax=Fusarium venenatum TaxID=56646 RepID=A0A2L2SS28_9HYPO|nr:uncharacterized protein FVRRES_13867 [Fusarium venenatum]CEI42055.1 unnamed protein product [Fusarium venenatum]